MITIYINGYITRYVYIFFFFFFIGPKRENSKYFKRIGAQRNLYLLKLSMLFFLTRASTFLAPYSYTCECKYIYTGGHFFLLMQLADAKSSS